MGRRESPAALGARRVVAGVSCAGDETACARCVARFSPTRFLCHPPILPPRMPCHHIMAVHGVRTRRRIGIGMGGGASTALGVSSRARARVPNPNPCCGLPTLAPCSSCRYFQWSPEHNQNSNQFNVKAGDQLHGTITYRPDTNSYDVYQSVVGGQSVTMNIPIQKKNGACKVPGFLMMALFYAVLLL